MLLAAGCGAVTPKLGTADGGSDAGLDGGSDARSDAGADAGPIEIGDGGADGGAFALGVRQWRAVAGGEYQLYAPSSFDGTARPLVVMLHGCTQTPDDFATGTRMDAIADREDFFVAYPAQPPSSNSLRCWNWFEPADQVRGGPEPAFLAAVVADVEELAPVDGSRIYAAGMSAGAAMAVVLGATYPDLFAAVASHSGLEYAAATDASGAYAASLDGAGDPQAHGDLAFQAMGAFARPVPVLVIQGEADTTVDPSNAAALAAQWAETDARAGSQVSAAPSTSDSGTAGGLAFTHSTYVDASSGQTLIEIYDIDDLGHAWSGGDSRGSYTDTRGPNASELVWSFFAAHPK